MYRQYQKKNIKDKAKSEVKAQHGEIEHRKKK